MVKNKNSFDENLKKLSAIAEWFDNQEDVDVEEGLKQIKEGAQLIKETKKRLVEIENEFEEIKKDIEEDIPTKIENTTDENIQSDESEEQPF